jgi:hypothetical protein
MVNLLADGLSQHTKSILPLYSTVKNATSRVYLNFATTSIALLALAYSIVLYISVSFFFFVLVSTSYEMLQ